MNRRPLGGRPTSRTLPASAGLPVKSRVRRYLPEAGSRTIRSVPVIGLTFFTWGRGDDRPGLDGGLLPEVATKRRTLA